MVKQAGRIPGHIPIQVFIFIECKNVFVILLTASERFPLADLFTQVLNDAHPTRNILLGKPTKPVNR